ncbi:DUF5011 domain-containing protein [Bacillus salipaludis]|uniref:DUF5011 domain-containing protein n=1 Tax=Bacillus salipaludis TaxID=2547811 RepID=A0A4R5VTG4_9BACI|nr:immunoglobulin-like domain-containing protein [Bacillus salipaludis]TDK61750.1 DUF5011 domain-containing protein [Bacillus salipaludis]
MRNLTKIISFTIAITLLLNFLPPKLFHNNFENMKVAKADGLLTRDEAKKYEGMIAAGQITTIGLKSDGTVMAIGGDYQGRTDVGDWSNITQVAAYHQTVGLKKDGTVVAVGLNTYGQTNVSDWEDIIAVSAGLYHTVGLKKDGTVVAVGQGRFGETNLYGWKDIVQISASASTTLGLKSDGTVVQAGRWDYGQNKVNDWTDIVQVASGSAFSAGLKSDGTVVIAGKLDNSDSVSSWNNIVSISAGDGHLVGLKSDGTVVAAGNDDYGQTDVSSFKDIIAVSGSSESTVLLKRDGTVVASGRNRYGELNVGSFGHLIDIEKPSLYGITDRTIGLGSTFDVKNGVTAEDNVDGNLTSDIVITGEVDTSKTGIYPLTYTVSDKAGNTATISRTITIVVDDVKPILTGVSDKTIPYGKSVDDFLTYHIFDGLSAWDNIDGDITTKISGMYSGDITRPGTHVITYTVSDVVGNTTSATSHLTIVDAIKPVITGATNKTININSSFDSRYKVSATDNAEGNLTKAIKITGSVNTKKKGVYTLTYSVADSSGNKTAVVRKITVIDNVKPVISGTGNKTIKLNSSFNPKTGVTAKDNSDGSLTNKIKITGSVNTKKKGVYTLTYSVVDGSGNKTVVVRKITVDNVKPVIKGAANKTIKLKTHFNPKTGVTAKDNLDGNVTSKIKITGTVNIKKKGVYKLYYTVSDSSGNKTVVTRKITVK